MRKRKMEDNQVRGDNACVMACMCTCDQCLVSGARGGKRQGARGVKGRQEARGDKQEAREERPEARRESSPVTHPHLTPLEEAYSGNTPLTHALAIPGVGHKVILL